jgi:hypothetical protein
VRAVRAVVVGFGDREGRVAHDGVAKLRLEVASVLLQHDLGMSVEHTRDEIPPMPDLMQNQRDDFSAEVTNWRMKTCYTQLDEWFKYVHRFNLKWLIDPSPVGELEKRWLVGIGGLKRGDHVTFAIGDRQRLFTEVADERGEALAVFASPADEISLSREPAPAAEPTEDSERPTMFIRQLALQRVSSVQTRGTVIALNGLRRRGRSEFVIATTEGAEWYRVKRDGRPPLLGHWTQPLQGAAAAGGRLYGWTDQGEVHDLSRNVGALAEPPVRDTAAQLAAAVAGGADHVAFTPSSVLIATRGALVLADRDRRTLELAGEAVMTRGNQIAMRRTDGTIDTYRHGPTGLDLASESAQVPPRLRSVTVGSWAAAPTSANQVELIALRASARA